MESKQDKDENKTRNEVSVFHISMLDGREILKPISSSEDEKLQANLIDMEGGENTHHAPSGHTDASAEVNMEASITTDDVIRAGGFGARDDMSSFLPVASDSTDFEATIRDARGYEEPQGKVCRPGLGWKESKETK